MIAVVALFTAFSNAIAANTDLQLASGAAPVAVVGVAVIAGFAGLYDTVAAKRARHLVDAGAGTPVAVVGVAVIAFFVGPLDVGGEKLRVADPIARSGIAVGSLQNPVAAKIDLAVRLAAVMVVAIVVLALFVSSVLVSVIAGERKGIRLRRTYF